MQYFCYLFDELRRTPLLRRWEHSRRSGAPRTRAGACRGTPDRLRAREVDRGPEPRVRGPRPRVRRPGPREGADTQRPQALGGCSIIPGLYTRLKAVPTAPSSRRGLTCAPSVPPSRLSVTMPRGGTRPGEEVKDGSHADNRGRGNRGDIALAAAPLRVRAGAARSSGPFPYPVHRSPWKGNSQKFRFAPALYSRSSYVET